MTSARALTEAIRRVYSSYTRENSLSRDVMYDGERSKVGGSEELFDVGGRVIWIYDGSRWEEYDSSA